MEATSDVDKYKNNCKNLPLFAQDFIQSLVSDGKSTRTILEYSRDLLIFFKYVGELEKFKNIDINKAAARDILDKINAKDLEMYKLWLVGGDTSRLNSSSAFISRKLSVVRSLYKYLIKNELIDKDIAALVNNPKLQKKPISILENHEVYAIYDALEEDSNDKTYLRDKAIITLFFGTGLRVSELVSINIDDINFIKAEISVKRKGGNICIVHFNGDVEFALQEYINKCRGKLLGETKSDALFISHVHKRMTARAVEMMIKKYAIKANLGRKVTPHELRRTYGNEIYRKTNDIYLAGAALNHKGIQVTIDRYIPPNYDELKRISQDTTLTRKDEDFPDN